MTRSNRTSPRKLMKPLFIATALLVGGLASADAQAACGKVSIADMNWPSASFMANVDKLVLEEGYGCEVELIPGDTMPTSTSMSEKGEPDIAPELWSNSLVELLKKGVAEKRLRIAGESLSDGGQEGFWVPKYMVEKDPSLATIGGVRKNAKLFTHPEDPDKSALYGCPAGWNCQITAGHQFEALNLADAGFELIDPGSAAGLDGSIAKAYERKKPWLGYYWAPTAILGKYEMVLVDFGVGIDNAHWETCISQAECADPKPSMFPSSTVQTVTTEAFAAKASEAFTYLTKRSFTNGDLNKLLVWIDDNQADGETAAIYFLQNHAALWSPWVSADVAAKLTKATSSM